MDQAIVTTIIGAAAELISGSLGSLIFDRKCLMRLPGLSGYGGS
jgi:hypothetical protein